MEGGPQVHMECVPMLFTTTVVDENGSGGHRDKLEHLSLSILDR